MNEKAEHRPTARCFAAGIISEAVNAEIENWRSAGVVSRRRICCRCIDAVEFLEQLTGKCFPLTMIGYSLNIPMRLAFSSTILSSFVVILSNRLTLLGGERFPENLSVKVVGRFRVTVLFYNDDL